MNKNVCPSEAMAKAVVPPAPWAQRCREGSEGCITPAEAALPGASPGWVWTSRGAKPLAGGSLCWRKATRNQSSPWSWAQAKALARGGSAMAGRAGFGMHGGVLRGLRCPGKGLALHPASQQQNCCCVRWALDAGEQGGQLNYRPLTPGFKTTLKKS